MSSSQIPHDPYWKLRPDPPTPDDEICACSALDALMLYDDSSGNNPLYCVACTGEVAPERIGFDVLFADDIRSWLAVHRALYWLWLDSSEYEQWASDRLSDPNGLVNTRGREIVAHLNEVVPSYYLWFRPDFEFGPPSHCPICDAELSEIEGRNIAMCERCSILY